MVHDDTWLRDLDKHEVPGYVWGTWICMRYLDKYEVLGYVWGI